LGDNRFGLELIVARDVALLLLLLLLWLVRLAPMESMLIEACSLSSEFGRRRFGAPLEAKWWKNAATIVRRRRVEGRGWRSRAAN